jgi:hypothetical protein
MWRGGCCRNVGRASGAPLVLAHVLPDRPTLPLTAEAEFRRHRGDVLESAQDLLERIASDSGTEPRMRLAFGDPSERS